MISTVIYFPADKKPNAVGILNYSLFVINCYCEIEDAGYKVCGGWRWCCRYEMQWTCLCDGFYLKQKLQ